MAPPGVQDSKSKLTDALGAEGTLKTGLMVFLGSSLHLNFDVISIEDLPTGMTRRKKVLEVAVLMEESVLVRNIGVCGQLLGADLALEACSVNRI